MAKITGIRNEIKFTALGSVNDVHSDLSDNSAKTKNKNAFKSNNKSDNKSNNIFHILAVALR